ncbi:8750c1be-dc10-4543-9081-cb3a706f3031 [Sclerotinia trifoliorum]|uniref:8750c1be-dc10-4543-9081-cb3a706f3031 n=1 Tax=Sclerotinia trifoliorum TaxID=28548 RepID=A0A8H2W0E8_9HELO|nr:8750c1be-dc10-4543-9081-cb3a706f3031 [Sclerotinia trifoliorum]
MSAKKTSKAPAPAAPATPDAATPGAATPDATAPVTAPTPAAPAPKGKKQANAKAGEIGWENAPEIQKDPAALAARRGPIDVVFNEIERWNLLPVLGSGIHPISTSAAGFLCGLHALVYSYNAARDLAAPEGTPVPLADSVTAQELIAFRRSPEFWQEALEYLTAGGQLTFDDEFGMPNSKEQMLVQVKQFIPDISDNYTIADLHCLLGFLNKKYGTHYSIGDVTHGFNVRWDVQNKVWDLAYKVPTQSMDGGRGIRPVLWLYNDNYEREDESLHRRAPGRKEGMGHWMGFSTLHRDIDRHLIAEANSWFDDATVDAYLKEGVWIVTEDSQGYQADLEDHQDPRELEISKGCFVREPAVAQADPAPQGYKWVQAGPYVNGASNPGMIGIIPLRKLKKIERNVLRHAHDIAGANAVNILKNNAVKKDGRGLWLDFYIHRSIEATSKTGRKYADPKDPAKKFVKGFTFEDGEFLLDTHEPLKRLCARMIRMDGTSGRVKARNLQFLERAWGLPEQLPIAVKGSQKRPDAVFTPGMKAISGIVDKTDARYQYRKDMDVQDFKIKDLRLHCQARGLDFQEYGRTKVSMLAALVKYDSSGVIRSKAVETKQPEPVDEPGLPLRRVLADVPKIAGPPKMPPFHATEIVLEIGKGTADDPATWVRDYEGRFGRIDEKNLEPIKGAWGIELDMLRWNKMIGDMRKDAGWGSNSKAQKEKAASKARAPKAKAAASKAAAPKPPTAKKDKKRPASEYAGPPAKRTRASVAAEEKALSDTAKAKAASVAQKKALSPILEKDEMEMEDFVAEDI